MRVCFVLTAVFAAFSLSAASNVLGSNWQHISGKLTRISKGNSGIWGVTSNADIFRRDSGSWTHISGGKLSHISSGASVWGVNWDDNIYMRNSGDSSWTSVSGKLINVDVSNKGRVWGVNRDNYIFRRSGSSWETISGRAKQVSVGMSGVWIVNNVDDIFYRTGTFGDVDTAGSGWQHISGSLKWISSGDGIVVGVNSKDEIFYRKGVSSTNPTGTGWVMVSGRLMQIDVDGNQAFGVTSSHDIFQGVVSNGCVCNSVDQETFDLDRVEYDLKAAVISKQPPKNVGKKIIRNSSSQSQTASYTLSRTITETSTFQHTAGVSVSVGTSFKCGAPFIASASVSLDVTVAYEFSAGLEFSEERTVTAQFNCAGAPHKITECDALLFSERMNVPFTRYWKEKNDPSCQCTDSGIFRKIAGHRLELAIKELGPLTVKRN